MNLEFELMESREVPGEWRVEAIDSADGQVYVAIFSGPYAQKRAQEYARWKNNQHKLASWPR